MLTFELSIPGWRTRYQRPDCFLNTLVVELPARVAYDDFMPRLRKSPPALHANQSVPLLT